MRELPTGTVTMLFADVEGSTRLLAQLGSRYADVVSAYRAVLRTAFARSGGHELGTEGDSFFVVFGSVGAALGAARDAQQALARVPWPDGVKVLVRMGLHTGEPARHEDGYVGMDVHRAARVAACAHGGQVVLTEATYRIAAERSPAGCRFDDLGLHRLKDLPAAEHLYQMSVDDLVEDFPPLRSLGSASSLPVPATSLVGRDRELHELLALLGRPAVRLLTLTGTAGTGKTRLALAAAAAHDRSDPGVYFVPLAHVRSAEVMWTTIADAVGIGGNDRAAAVLEHLAPRRLLLVLDNLEQLAGAAPVVRRLLDAGPGVHVLATSRRPLRLSAEHEYPVGPLPVPAAPVVDDGGGGGGAVELFRRRAQLVRPGFAVTADNAEDVWEICRLLDGLPLAVELVAARAKLLGPRALRARLDRSLDVARAAVDVPDRQQTLRSALDWSYDLLPPRLQVLFRRLGVCAGDFDLAAARAVAAEDDDPADAASDDADDAVDEIGELVDVSLLDVQEGADGEPRLRMLQTVARYAREVLVESGELEPTARRHAQHYLRVAEAAAEQLRGEHHLAARDTIERELGNMRAALAWSLGLAGGTGAGAGRTADDVPARGDDDSAENLEIGLRLCGRLSWFWYGCGYQTEGRRWLQAAVDAAGSRRSDGVMTALHGLGVLLLQQGEARRARELLQLCADHWRLRDDLSVLSTELNSLGMAHRALDDQELARSTVQEAVDVAARAGNARREANALSNLAILTRDAGDHEDAIAMLRRCLRLDTELHDAWGQGADHVNIVGTLLRAGRVDEAHAHLLEHGASAVALDDVDITVDVLELFAVLHAERGDAERVARLLGVTERMREESELPLAPPDAAWFESVLSAVRGLPDAVTWQRNVRIGTGFGVDEALADAMP